MEAGRLRTGRAPFHHQVDWLPRSTTPLDEAAVGYAENGMAVIPVWGVKDAGPHARCLCDKPDCSAVGKHPIGSGWPKKASSDPDTVRRARRGKADANIGLMMGGPDRLVAIDIDGPRGYESLAAVERDSGPWPVTLTSRSGRDDGGEHRIYRVPAHLDVRRLGNRASHRWPGIDTRADGGQIVAPPSLHASGGRYDWKERVPIAELPLRIFEALAKPAGPRARPEPESKPGAYARGALAREGALVRAAQEGTRNSRLNTAAFNLGQLVGAGALEETEVRSVLTEAARATGLEAAEVDATMTRSLEAGKREPRTRGRNDAAPAAEPADRTDLGNCGRFVKEHAGVLRFVGPWARWFSWNGARWCEDHTGVAEHRAKETVRQLLHDAADAAAGPEREAVRWALKSHDAGRIRDMLRLARSAPEFSIHHDALDADPWLLNVQNGTLNLRTGRLRPHDPADLITKLAPVQFDPDATCPTWDVFVDRSMGGNKALVGFLRRFVGYALVGVTREQVLGFLFGNGANGKSTFVMTLHAIMGDYAVRAPRGLLFESRNSHPTALTTLFRARFVSCAEVPKGAALDEALVKDLTGGDLIMGRRMREDFWTFAPTHKLFLAGNHKPIVRDGDDGIWRRIRLIPWTVTVPPEERDPQLPEKLVREAPGILAWAVRGCLEWQRDGLGEPPAVTAATAAYRVESDPLREFFDLRLVFSPDAIVSRKDVRIAYEAHCKDNGDEAATPRELGAALRGRGVTPGSVRRHGQVLDAWRGVRLATDADIEPGRPVGSRDQVGSGPMHDTIMRARVSVTGKQDPTGPYLPADKATDEAAYLAGPAHERDAIRAVERGEPC